jgi:hypothetical protein
MCQSNQQNPWTKNFKAASCSDVQEIPNILWNWDLHGRVHFLHLSLSWAKLSWQFYRCRPIRRLLHNTQQAIEAEQTSMPSAGFQPAIPVIKRPQTYVLYHNAIGPSNLLLRKQFSPNSCCFLLLRFKHFYQHPVFKLCHVKFLPYSNLICSTPLLSNRQTVV